MINDQKNTILAIGLSRARADRLAIFHRRAADGEAAAGSSSSSSNSRQQQHSQQPRRAGAAAGDAPQPGTTAAARPTRRGAGQRAVARPDADPRGRARRLAARAIDTPTLQRLDRRCKGGRIDDLSLIKYRETVDPKSPPIVLLSPSGSPHPFYAEFGWVAGRRQQRQAAGRQTRSGRQQGARHARRRHGRSRWSSTTARGWNSAAPITVDDELSVHRRGQVVNKRRSRSRSIPMR